MVTDGLDGIKAAVYQLIFLSLHPYDLLDMEILCHNLILDWRIGNATTAFHFLHFDYPLMQDLAQQLEYDNLKKALLKGATLSVIQDFLLNYILQCK